METLTTVGVPPNLKVLDEVVTKFYATGDPRLNEVMTIFKEREDSLRFVDQVISSDQASPATRFIGCCIMQDLVKYKWNTISGEHQSAMKTFVANTVINWSGAMAHTDSVLLALDSVFVGMVIRDWPQRWPSIIEDLIGASRSAPSGFCMNTLTILKIMSKEIMEFGEGLVVSSRISQLERALRSISSLVYGFIEFVMSTHDDTTVVLTAIRTLQVIVKWLDPEILFTSDLPRALVHRFLGKKEYFVAVFGTLGELALIQGLPDVNRRVFPDVFEVLVGNLKMWVPTEIEALVSFADENEDFMESLTFMLAGFFSNYVGEIESGVNPENIGIALQWIVNFIALSPADAETPPEYFKSCCEMLATITKRAYTEAPGVIALYGPYFAQLRRVLIGKMQRPDEVIMVKADDGSMIRERTKNTLRQATANTMRETLVFLSNLDTDDMSNAFDQYIAEMNTRPSLDKLDRLCWSAGAVSGTMSIASEKAFATKVLRELFNVNKAIPTIEGKAVAASGIMFICSRYPRFLTGNWAFMEAIVDKIFEFLTNDTAVIREMAVNTFVTVAENCMRHFHLPHGGSPPMVMRFVTNLDSFLGRLDDDLKTRMFEGVAIVISGAREEGVMAGLVVQLMSVINARWQTLFAALKAEPGQSENIEWLVAVLLLLRINATVAEVVGGSFQTQLFNVFEPMVGLYQTCSIKSAQMFESVSGYEQHPAFKLYHGINGYIISIIAAFVKRVASVQTAAKFILPGVMSKVVELYPQLPAVCRVPSVLALVSAITERVADGMTHHHVLVLLTNVFVPTCDMLAQDHTSFPDFRLDMVVFLEKMVKKSYRVLFQLPVADEGGEKFGKIERMIEWSCESPDQEICRGSLALLRSLFVIVQQHAPVPFKNSFYGVCFQRALACGLKNMVDTMHKFAFNEQVKLIETLLAISIPLNTPMALVTILASLIENHEQGFFESFVKQLNPGDHADFRAKMRDFLICIREYSVSDLDLFGEEQEQRREAGRAIDSQINGLDGPALPEEVS